MKKIFLLIFICPLLSNAQTNPRFHNDTLYTAGGYPIYPGRTLQLATGTSAAGYFRFIKFHNSMARNNTYTLQNSSILVKQLKNYRNSGPDNTSIRIIGTASYPGGKTEEVDMIVHFDQAIANFDGQPAELTVPAEYIPAQSQNNTATVKKVAAPVETKKPAAADDLRKLMVADEIRKLFELHKEGALTKEEFEAQKKKLLERQ